MQTLTRLCYRAAVDACPAVTAKLHGLVDAQGFQTCHYFDPASWPVI
jgi:hypothetical protein